MQSTTTRRILGGLALVLALGTPACSAPACSASETPPATTGDLGRVAELREAGDQAGALTALRAWLESDADACQRALLEPSFADGFRDRPEFRQAIHDAALRHGTSKLQLVGRDEPGEWLEITARVVDGEERPVPGATVRVFATDAAGRYHPEIEGERTPRIFGTLVSDDRGEVRFSTVRPGSYPGTRNVRHVHVSVRADDRRLAAPQYAVFDDDPLLEEPQNAEPRGEALRIRMRDEGGRRLGELTLPVR